MKIIQHTIIIVFISSFFFACEKDDFTGHSQLRPTSPVITVTIPPQSDLEDITQYVWDITVTMDVAQIVDVAIHSIKVGGDAMPHDDYEIEDRIIIPKGETQGVFKFEITSLELNDGPLTVTLQIGDARTANADITPVQFVIDRNP